MGGIELIISTICNATFCEPVYDNPITDSLLTNKQTELLKLMNAVNGKHLKIATYNNIPLSWVEPDNNGTLVGNGVSFLIVDILQAKFNFTYEIVVPKRNYEIGGNPSDSIIGLLNSSQVDMAAAFLPKLTRFQRMVTFSTDLDEGVWMMLLKRPKASAAGSGLMAPFNSLVWYLTLAAVLVYGPCITFLTRLRSKFLRDEERHLPLSPSFWFVYSAFIKQGTNLAPDANSTRILFATWWMFIILLSAFYTANLTAFLTLSKFTLDIETPEDLYKKNYRWVAVEGSSVEYTIKSPNEQLYFLNKMITNGRAEFRSFSSDDSFLTLVDNGAVLVKETIAIDHIMYGDYLRKAREGVNEADRCTYVVAPKPFMKKHRAFAYPLGSPLKRLFDTVLVYILQAGIIDFLAYKDLPSTRICPLDLQSKDRQLRNSDLLMTYLIMGSGLCAATAVFLGEVIIKRYVHNKHLKVDQTTPKEKRDKKRKQREDDSRPPPYDSLFGNSKYNINENSKRKIVNGREYYEYKSSTGDMRLIPVRTPSAFLYR